MTYADAVQHKTMKNQVDMLQLWSQKRALVVRLTLTRALAIPQCIGGACAMTVPQHSISVDVSGEEEWRPVVGFEGFYEVSSYGRVRALFDACKNRFKSGRILAYQKQHKGHIAVTLMPPGRKRKRFLVHRLVWLAFCGVISDGFLVRHWDGNPRNNVPGNLRMGTHQDNVDDTVRHGHTTQGERSGQAKLSNQDIYHIRARLASGEYQYVIAADFGVSQSRISSINTGKSWKHI